MKDTKIEPIKIFIADDEESFLGTMKIMLSKDTQFEIVGTATSLKETLVQLRKTDVDLLVLDVVFPNKSVTGLDLIAVMRAMKPNLYILVITGLGPGKELESMRAKAHGFLLKPFSIGDFREAASAILKGKTFYNMGTLEKLQEDLQISTEPVFEKPPELTEDDWEYLKMKLQGIDDVKIATMLKIEGNNIYQKRWRIAKRLCLETDVETFLLGKLRELVNIKTG